MEDPQSALCDVCDNSALRTLKDSNALVHPYLAIEIWNMICLKILLLLTVVAVAHAYRHCPMDDDSYCPVICKPFKKQVPRPIIFNFCMIGCKAGVATDKVDCDKSCMHTDLPRPTTADACKSGCNGALSELHACNVLAKRNSKSSDLWIGWQQ